MKPLVILINGKARSGKDFLAELIKEHNIKNVSILHNAAAVKTIAKNFFGWDGIKDEKGRRLLIDISNVAYNYDDYFWERKTENNIIPLYDEIIVIPDFRYTKTNQYFRGKGYRVITVYIEMDKDINDINNEVKNDLTEQKQDIKFDYEIVNEYGNVEKLIEFVKDNLIF